jgi:lipoprotein signal peptidase
MDDILTTIDEYLSTDMPQPLEVVGAMILSFLLNLFIAQLYRSTYKGTRYSQDFVQTLIMIGTITTILIMVVRGNSGIAFGMFAAFSMIRFRRNLGQARDLGFVFFAMATGMVVGATLSRPARPRIF